MLLEFRFANFRSFAEEQVISFVADKDPTLPTNTAPCEPSPTGRVTRLAVVYGPNGGGKSTLVRAFDLVRTLVVRSATDSQEGDPLPIEPFKLDPTLLLAPSRFEVSFIADWHDPDAADTTRAIRYQYGFQADRTRIHEEWLIAYPHGQPQTWFERKPGDEWEFGRHLKGEKTRIARSTRSNALFLSVAAQQNQAQLLPPFRWFRSQLRTLGASGEITVGDPVALRMPLPSFLTTGRLRREPAFREWLVGFLKSADVGIEDVRLEERPFDERHLPPGFPDALRPLFVPGQPETLVRTLHRGRDGGLVEWALADESDGTQSLYCLAGPWFDMMSSGRTVFVDDLFSNLHSTLTRHLLTTCLATENPSGPTGQLCLTTHDTNLLDPKLLRRDQIWFVEKDREGASHLYSLLDYRPRKNETFERGYLAGRYGALPYLGDASF